MVISKALKDNFSSGKVNLVESSALLNPYAKWMQSPNIPKINKAPINLENMDDILESDPDVKEWFKKIQIDTNKRESVVPCFFPDTLKTYEYYSCSYKCPERFVYALLSSYDMKFQIYSEESKKDAIHDVLQGTLGKFKDIFKASIYRSYGLKKNQIYDSILSLDPANNTSVKNISFIPALHMISEFIEKNIIILRKFNYEWACLYKPERDTCILWEDGVDVGFIRNSNNTSIEVKYVLNHSIDIDSNRTTNIRINSNDTKRKILSDIKKMTFVNLKEYAENNNISLIDETGELLKKNELLVRIINFIVEN